MDPNELLQQATSAVQTAFSNLNLTTADNIASRWVDIPVLMFACICLFMVADFVVASRFGKERYYALHVMVNIGIVSFCFEDMIRGFRDPMTCNTCVIEKGQRCASNLPLILNLCLHLYHPLFFKLNRMDWIHHIPAYIVSFTSLFFVWGGNFAFAHFVVVGFPGGLDYALLVALGQGWIQRDEYKGYCATINVWLRCSMGQMTTFLGLIGLYQQWDDTSTAQIVVSLGHALHNYWNSLFFMRQAVEAHVLSTLTANGAFKEGENIRVSQLHKMYAKKPGSLKKEK